MNRSTTHKEFPDYGWTVPVGADDSHYVLGARLVGRAGWLGTTSCNLRSGGNLRLQSTPPRGRACPVCRAKAGI